MTKTTFWSISVGLLCLFSNTTGAQTNNMLNQGNGFNMHGTIKMGNKGAYNRHLLTAQVPYEQITEQTVFFGGDTLNGYDQKTVLNQAISRFKIFSELRVYMRRNEIAFVKKKYNIAELPFEKAANAKKINNPPTVMASACSNTDFENGNFTGWTGGYGYNDNSAAVMTTTSATILGAGNNSSVFACNAYHTLTTAAGGNDYYAGAAIPMLDAGGGTYAVRLGNENMNLCSDGTYANDCTVNNACYAGDPAGAGGSGAEYLQQTFTVSAGSTLFSFNYAAVLSDGGHLAGEQPYFEIEVYDHTGAVISCFSQHVELQSGVAPPGGYDAGITDDCALGELYYVPWQTSSLDLTSYVGQAVTVKFTAAGCIYGAHFGYAYFDASCGSTFQITASNNSPCAGTNVTLTIPSQPGQTYAWSGPGIVSSSGNTATINATGTYSVAIGTGACKYTVTKTITFVAKPTVTVNSPTVCTGSSVNLTAAGATTYTWNTGSTSNPLSVTPGATSYTVTGANASGCTNTAVSTLTVVAKPTVTVNSPTVCSGSSVNLTGGGASTYTWNTGSSANPLSVTPGATSYTVTGTSAAGCTNTAVSTVTVVALPTVTVNSPTVCNGSSVNLTAAGASTYTWNTGSSANPLSVTPGATSYTVTGTSAAGCTNTAVSTVTVVALPTVTVNSPTVCNGSSVNLTAAGASTYTWNTGSTSNPLSVTPGATSYTVTGTAATGCKNTAVSTVTVVALPTVTVNSPTVCNGSSVNLTAAGASTYTWNTGSSANPLSVTPGATSYTVTGTAATGCTNTAVSTVTVVAKPTVTVNSPTVCSGSSVSLTAAGASTYTWNTGSSANPLSVTPGATSYTVTGTSAAGCTNTAVSTVTVVALPTVTVNSPTVCSGSSVNLTAAGASTYTWNTGSSANPLSVTPGATSYTVTGTSAAGCTNTAVSTVTVVALPTYTLASNTYTICQGNSQGLSVSGASTYTWTPAATLAGANTATPTASPTTTTIYSVTGTAASGCSNLTPATVTVTVNPKPTYSLTGNAYTICNGGSQTFTVSGANTYTWTPAATLTGANTANPTASPATTTVYSVTGTTALGCGNLTPATVTVNVTAVPSMTLAANSYTICNGSSQTFTASGASTYTWTSAATLTGANTANPTANPSTTTVYTVTGTAAGCAPSPALTVTLTVNPLPTYSLMANSYTICNGSSQVLSVSGASTYTWTPAATLTGANTANPTANPTTTTVYSVTGTNANACTNLIPVTVTVNVNPLPTYSLTGNAYTICNGGSQMLSVSGASTYTWTPAATLDNANIASPTASPTTTTVYSVTGTDANACTNLTPATVTVNVTAIPSMTLAANSYTICNGASQMFNASGASTYTWTPASTLDDATIANPTANPTTTTVYTVNGTASGCAPSPALTVTLTVNPLPTYTLASNSYTICNGSSQVLSVSGASSYTWTPGATLNDSTLASPTASPTTATVYSVIGTDANACSNLIPATVTVNVNPLPTYSLTSNVYTICNGGSQMISVSGASSYTWTPGATLSDSTLANPVASPTTTTVYSVTGTDANACTNLIPATVTVNVTSVPSMTLTANSYTICNGGSQILTVGGVSTYSWTPAATLNDSTLANPTANPTTTTVYTVTGTASGCAPSPALTVTLTVNPLPTYTLASNSYTICNGDSQVLSASGASTYTWTPASTLDNANLASPTATPNTTTVYSVTGTDANACTNLIPATVTVNVNPLPTYSLTGNVYTICNGGTQMLSVSGASTYTWTPAATLDNANISNPTASPTTTTVYSVTGTDANACTNLTPATVTVNVTTVPSMTLTADSYTICNGGSQMFTVSGASTYTWTPASTLDNAGIANPTANPTTTTVYTVNGTASGCAPSPALTVTLTVNPTPTISIVPLGSNSVICNGASVIITPTGATSYTLNPGNQVGTSFTLTPSASTTYTIDGTNGSTSCSNATTDAAVVPITVNPTPTISINPLGSNSVICNGGSVVITPTGATTYTLNPGNQVGTSFTVSPTSNTTYTIDGSDGTTNCANATSNAAIVPIMVNPTPTISIAPLGSNSVICSGALVVITPSGATTYTLNPGNQVGTSFTVSPTSSTTYTIDGSDGSTTCTNSSANAGLAPIVVNQTPVLDLSGAGLDSAKCGQATGGVNGITNSSVSLGTSPYTFQWYNATTGQPIAGANSPSLSGQLIGSYSLQVIDANHCVANVNGGGSSTFTVPASAAIHALASANPTTGSIPLVVTFTNISTGGGSGYVWSFGDGNTSTQINPTNTYTNVGTYTVTLTAVNGTCSDTYTLTVIANVPTTITIPNVFSPNGDGVNDEFFIPNTGIETLNCDIFNRWGQLLHTLTAPNQSWDGITPNGDKAPEGTYMYLLNAKGLDGQVFSKQGTLMLVR